jgi:uncharacterized 2Fe-2S/4Fe-4S cluster protein (DUF4445 family)
MARVVFTPSGLHTDAETGTSVLEVARSLGVDIDSVCGGRGICGRCQITPSIGTFPKWGVTSDVDSLSAPSSTETDYRGKRPMQPGNRLSCAALVCADTVIDVPAASQVHRQVVRKNIDLTDVVVDPVVSLHYLQLGPNDEGISATDLIVRGLQSQHQITAILDTRVMPVVVAALNKERGHVTVAVSRATSVLTVVGIWTGFVDAVYGFAVDIGSTTIAGHLCDLATGEVVASGGRMNPQIRFGEDLMSRVSYVMMNPGGEVELTRAVRMALDELVGELCQDAHVERNEVLDCVFVGNPVMHHLLLGFDPVPLGQSPFTLATNLAVHTRATDLDVDLPFASVYVGPCIAGHVGADTTAAMLAEGPHRGDEWQLLVDVGTNAEIVLGTKDRQFAASSPTGPAFEGAQLVSGQRATAGAIERVRIDPVTLEPRFRVIGSELWSNEPGFGASVAKTGVTGICGSGIIEVIAQMYLVGICDQDGVISAEVASRSDRLILEGRTYTYLLWSDSADADDDADRFGDRRVVVTQNDVRQIQLAKAALRAGIDLLIEHAGSPQVSDVRLAGAFGAHIDPLHAILLGLVPDAPVEGVRAVGNAAGGGAVRALLSRSLRTELECAASAVTKIETATEPRFQELFVAAMAFPHATASTQHLSKLVTLPQRRAASDEPGGRRGRRGRTSTPESPPSSSAGLLTEEPS